MTDKKNNQKDDERRRGNSCKYAQKLNKSLHNILRKHKDGKIWLHTGDIGYIALNGVVYYTQRLKRMIVVSGFNVYPSVIEEVLSRHEAVDKVCVIGIPHVYKMHVPKAIIVLKKGYQKTSDLIRSLKTFSEKELSVYERPKEYEFRDSLPKTLYNKVDYRALEKEEEQKTKK